MGVIKEELLNVYDKNNILYRLKLYKAFAWIMNEEKTQGSQWRIILKAQYQNSIVLSDGTVILLDGPAIVKPDMPYFDLSLGELISLSKLVDKSKKFGVITIPLNFKGSEIPEPVKNYGYPDILTNDDQYDSNIELSSNTFRPVVIDRKFRKHWKECSEQTYGPLNKQISNYNYFIKYVDENIKYPSKEEFIKFTSSRQANKETDAKDTLPKHTVEFVDGLFKNYEKILGENFLNIPSDEFKRITINSRSEIDRAVLDGSNDL
jgi:hypothetical protein